MTLKQIHHALTEWNEDVKLRIRIAGHKIEEDDHHEATLQDLMAFGG